PSSAGRDSNPQGSDERFLAMNDPPLPSFLAQCQICFAPRVSWPKLSRDGRPEGSGHPFGWGDAAWRRNPYPAGARPASASPPALSPAPHGLRLRVAYPCGEEDGLTTFRRCAEVGWVAALRRWCRICAGGVRSPRT